MKKLLIVLSMLCMMMGFTVTANAAVVTVPVTVTENYTEAFSLLNEVNKERANRGFQPVVMDSGLMEIAMKRAAETCVYYSHSSADGGTAGVRKYLKGTVLDKGNIFVYVGEDIGVGVSNAPDMLILWKNSTTHGGSVKGADVKYLGVGVVDYGGTRYWVTVTTKEPLGSVANTQTGNIKKTHKVDVSTDLLKPFRMTDSVVYGDMNDNEPIMCQNLGDDMWIALGYMVEDPSLLRITANNPEIFTVDSMGHVRPHKAGTGSMSVSVAGCAPATISVTVRPQSGQYTDSNGKNYNFKVSLPQSSYSYTGKSITPKSTVKDWYGVTMLEGVDYTLSYSNNVNPGIATVTVNAIEGGNYSGRIGSANFSITGTIPPAPPETKPTQPPVKPAEPQKPATPDPKPETPQKPVTPTPKPDTSKKAFNVKLSSSSCVYTGKAIKPKVAVYAGSKKLSSSYYTVAYKNNTKVGTASVYVQGKGKYSSYSGKATFKIQSAAFKLKLSKTSYTYNGKSQKPKVTVYAGSKKLSSKYYSVSMKNNKNVGTATITVKGKGKYSAYSGKAAYKILPRKASLYTPKSRKKGYMEVKWKKDTQTSGFQIQYATSKSFKNAKTYTVKGNTKTGVTIKKLKSRKSYYVRVRTYKKISGKNWYGSWSSMKKVKIK